jgi:hypothetical protein
MDPYFPIFSSIGDFIIELLMQITINEDVKILSNVDDDYREGNLITKYDVTIQNFRKDVKKFLQNSE